MDDIEHAGVTVNKHTAGDLNQTKRKEDLQVIRDILSRHETARVAPR